MILKKMFNSKRKQKEPGRHNTNKITLDPASAAILSRHFSPMSSRAKSPSDLLDIVGYPLTATISNYKPSFSQSSPELTTPLNQDKNSNSETKSSYRLTIRNNTTPSPVISASPELQERGQDYHSQQLLETSREDKTLVEKEIEDNAIQVYRLQQKLLEFEHEREAWNKKLQGYIEREEQMRRIIQESQQQINQLRYGRTLPSRHNSYHTISTHSSSWPTEPEGDLDNEDEEDEEEEENEQEEAEGDHRMMNHYNDFYYHNHHQPAYPVQDNQHVYQYYNKHRYNSGYHYYLQRQHSWHTPHPQQQYYYYE